MKITIKDQDLQWTREETQETMAPGAMTTTTGETMVTTTQVEIENCKMINIEIQIDKITIGLAMAVVGSIQKKIIDVIITITGIEIMLMIEIKEDHKETIVRNVIESL